MRIAVISDTHNLLRPEVTEQIRRSDAVIHAGDIGSAKIVEQIRSEMRDPAAFYAVCGNADEKWVTEKDQIPVKRTLEFGQLKIEVVHNRKDLASDPLKAQMIIFGHSHRYLAEEKDGRFWLNPGCCGRRRIGQEVSMAVLEIRDGKWDLEKIVLDAGSGSDGPSQLG